MAITWRDLRIQAARFKEQHNIPKAIESLEEAIRISYNAHPLDLAMLRNSLAALYLRCDNCSSAEASVRQAIDLEIEFGDCGRETTNLADHYILLTKILEKQQRFSEALQYADKGLAIFVDLLGGENALVKGVQAYRSELESQAWKG